MINSFLKNMRFSFSAVFNGGYTKSDLRADVLSGLTVSIIAIPLAMALGIASGVEPHNGLYTAIVAGLIIALFGGSPLSVSGPTAAFVVLLLPIVQQYGLAGLQAATCMAGLFLIAIGLFRLGRWVVMIPHVIVHGFTAGIAVVLFLLQAKDFFGNPNYGFETLFDIHLPSTLVGLATICGFLIAKRLVQKIPAHLFGLGMGMLAFFVIQLVDTSAVIETIGSRFPNMGTVPKFNLFFNDLPNGLATLGSLVPSAISITFLGAVESLLCAASAKQASQMDFDPDAELVGQGLGNMVVPFFGGIPATGAMARTSANIKAGGKSAVSAALHAVFICLWVMIFANLLFEIPLPALAGILMMTAIQMFDMKQTLADVSEKPLVEKIIFAGVMLLTILFNMVVAVVVGVCVYAGYRYFFYRTGLSINNPDPNI